MYCYNGTLAALSSSDGAPVYNDTRTGFEWPSEWAQVAPASPFDPSGTTDAAGLRVPLNIVAEADATTPAIMQGVVIQIIAQILTLIRSTSSSALSACVDATTGVDAALLAAYQAAGADIANLAEKYLNVGFSLYGGDTQVNGLDGAGLLDAVLALVKAQLCCAGSATVIAIIRNEVYPDAFWDLFNHTSDDDIQVVVAPTDSSGTSLVDDLFTDSSLICTYGKAEACENPVSSQ